MKYTITLNQPLMIKYNLNMTKWCMLDILSIAPTWSDVIVVDNKPYYHISRNKIVDELKALDLKPDTVYRYLKELTENGFILYIKKDGKDLITFTQKAKNLFRENHSEKNPNSYENSENFPNKLGKKSENHSEKNPTYKYTRINKNTNIKEKDKKENSETKDYLLDELLEEDYQYFMQFKNQIRDFIQYRKKIKKALKTTAPIKAFIQALMDLQKIGYSIEFCIEQMKANEWQTIKPDYIHKPQKVQNNISSKQDKTKAFVEDYYKRKAEANQNSNADILDAEVI